LDTLVANLDVSQKEVTANLQETLVFVQKTSQSAIPVMQQTQKDLADLEPVIQQSQELLKQTTDTMNHVSGATQDVQTEIHKFIFPPPQPWYKKYIFNPLRIVTKMITVPVSTF
jgi:hypothetical protein